MEDLILEDQHIPPQSFHSLCNGRNRILHGLYQLLHSVPQLPPQRSGLHHG